MQKYNIFSNWPNFFSKKLKFFSNCLIYREKNFKIFFGEWVFRLAKRRNRIRFLQIWSLFESNLYNSQTTRLKMSELSDFRKKWYHISNKSIASTIVSNACKTTSAVINVIFLSPVLKLNGIVSSCGSIPSDVANDNECRYNYYRHLATPSIRGLSPNKM